MNYTTIYNAMRKRAWLLSPLNDTNAEPEDKDLDVFEGEAVADNPEFWFHPYDDRNFSMADQLAERHRKSRKGMSVAAQILADSSELARGHIDMFNDMLSKPGKPGWSVSERVKGKPKLKSLSLYTWNDDKWHNYNDWKKAIAIAIKNKRQRDLDTLLSLSAYSTRLA